MTTDGSRHLTDSVVGRDRPVSQPSRRDGLSGFLPACDRISASAICLSPKWGSSPFTTEAAAREIQNNSGLPQGPAVGSVVGYGAADRLGGEARGRNATAGVHCAPRRRGGRAPNRGAGAGGDAGGWLPRHFITRHLWLSGRRIPPRP